jgi:hypothetical protein
MKKSHALVACAFAAMLWTPGIAADAAEAPMPTDAVDWPAFMGRHDLLWTVLPQDWPQSAFLGNGLHGTSVFGDVDGGLRWDVGRRDVLDSRSRMAIGRFVMPPAGPAEAFRMRLDLWNAEARGTWEGPDGTLNWRTVTHAGDPVTVIELEGPASVRDLPVRFVQEPAVNAGALFKKFEAMDMRYTRWSTVKDPEVLAEIAKLAAAENPPSVSGKTRGIQWCRQPFKRGGGYSVAWGERTTDDGKRLFAFTVDFDPAKPAGTDKAVRDVQAALAAPRDEWLARHRDWWHAYYRQSFLSIPDTRMESFYWIQMYKLGAATRADRPAIDLMGPWTYRTPWPRIWWNLNIQLTYWPVYASNRLNIGESLVRMIDAGRQNLINNVPDESWRADSAGIGRTSIWDCGSRVGKEPGNLSTEKVPGGEVTVVDLKKGESVLLASADEPLPPADLRTRAVDPGGPLNTYGLHGEAAERVGVRAGQAVRPNKDGFYRLKASYALLEHGPKLEYHAKVPNIGFWTDARGTATWKLKVRKPGRYEVVLRSASTGGNNTLAIEVAGKTVTWPKQTTGAWDRFRDFPAGTLALPKQGTVLLTVKSADGKAPMLNLQQLALRPVKGLSKSQ